MTISPNNTKKKNFQDNLNFKHNSVLICVIVFQTHMKIFNFLK